MKVDKDIMNETHGLDSRSWKQGMKRNLTTLTTARSKKHVCFLLAIRPLCVSSPVRAPRLPWRPPVHQARDYLGHKSRAALSLREYRAAMRASDQLATLVIADQDGPNDLARRLHVEGHLKKVCTCPSS